MAVHKTHMRDSLRGKYIKCGRFVKATRSRSLVQFWTSMSIAFQYNKREYTIFVFLSILLGVVLNNSSVCTTKHKPRWKREEECKQLLKQVIKTVPA